MYRILWKAAVMKASNYNQKLLLQIIRRVITKRIPLYMYVLFMLKQYKISNDDDQQGSGNIKKGNCGHP